ncbi:RecQ family ATP-dependent DNA helicase [Flavisolibacter nicotianae]|uniref:RecQ family ATP-dependent DNA helicase n=1 Tax=Flavisolibacter nicotianae TaxID=2364882 RepID=UPI000EB25AC4|nr:ATP-dependent DNA helicase RecQ [Flavisolibacter nicotianae]
MNFHVSRLTFCILLIHDILSRYWGYEAFRPQQEEIIQSILDGKDTLALLPTGGGKSICYQVPALAQEGICLVVSPLIALMKDQVENLKSRGIGALVIYSGMQRKDVIRTLENARQSYFKFLYVSPERLETSLFKEYLPALDVNLIAVDEAHCISQWGYDFRPSYLKIAALREELPGVPVLAVTASATARVQEDICEKLAAPLPPKRGFSTARTSPIKQSAENTVSSKSGPLCTSQSPLEGRGGFTIFRQSFKRENLSYSVFREDAKPAKLVDILKKVGGSAIVYCKSRKRTTEMAALLQMHGLSADFYHAGLPQDQRNRRQQDWIDNKTRIIVCTNAFGMGIDKPDVRLVVHVDAPDCLENYYQEAGRCGRDGKKAYAVLLYHEKDVEELENLHITRFPTFEVIQAVYEALGNYLQIHVHTGQDRSYDFRFDEFVRNFKLNVHQALYALQALESDGWISYNEKNFIPSTLGFTTTKEQLYEFYRNHPEHEELLVLLLRTYEGIYDFPVFISEAVVARLLREDEARVKEQLRRITAFGIISYTPQNDSPQIILRKNRVATRDLKINLAQYNRRKEQFIERVKTMVDYLKTGSCRSRFISTYFGDGAAADCGICDNCLSRRRAGMTTDEFTTIASAIKNHLAQKALTADELVAQLPANWKEKAWQVLQFLQAEKQVAVNSRGLLQNKPAV